MREDPIVSLGVTPFLIGSCLLSGIVNQNLIDGCLLLETVNHPYLSVLTFATGFYTTTIR